MHIGRVAIVGEGGLLGELIASEMARHGEVTPVGNCRGLGVDHASVPDVIVFWSQATGIAGRRAALRERLPATADPLLVILNADDPHIYFTRLRELHVERTRLRFDDMFNEIAGRVASGRPRTSPVRAGAR